MRFFPFLFFFNDTATTEIYTSSHTLSLHDALPIQAADFFQGALTTALTADEIIVEVRLPAWPRERRWAFEEFARRRGDFAMAAAAVFFDQNDDGTAREAHVGVVGVADRPLRLPSVEAVLNGR